MTGIKGLSIQHKLNRDGSFFFLCLAELWLETATECWDLTLDCSFILIFTICMLLGHGLPAWGNSGQQLESTGPEAKHKRRGCGLLLTRPYRCSSIITAADSHHKLKHTHTHTVECYMSVSKRHLLVSFVS